MAKRIRVSTATVLKLTAILAFVAAARLPCSRTAPSDAIASRSVRPRAAFSRPRNRNSSGMTAEEATRRSQGCLDCHNGIEDMHDGKINLGCIDCHGGDASARAQGLAQGSAAYEEAKRKAHVQPRFPRYGRPPRIPNAPTRCFEQESAEFIRFVNPGDLRVAAAQLRNHRMSCPGDVHTVGKSMMTTGAMLWGAALYNNGSFPLKNYRFGESYGADGKPQRLQTVPQPTAEETQKKGVLLSWIRSRDGRSPDGQHPAHVRARRPQAAGDRPSKPRRAAGQTYTESLEPARTRHQAANRPGVPRLAEDSPARPDAVVPGTNDQPGDYRSSGCTACHVVYANDRDPFNAGPYAKFGHTGQSAQRRPHDSKERTRPSDQASVDSRDPFEPVRRLSHAPRNHWC